MSVLITSKNTTSENGFLVGNSVEKDMYNDNYTYEFNPSNYPEFFPNMAELIDENIVQGDKLSEDRLIASTWNDLGDDVFDDWGYFIYMMLVQANITFL
jgi:hypothetical protein